MSPAVSSEHALPMLNRLFISALVALAAADNVEQACRLAAQGYSALRRCHPREAERLNAVMHNLSRHPSIASLAETGAML